MLAEGVNGLLGHSALIIGLAASVFGGAALATATLLKDQRLVRTVQAYGWVGLLGAVLAPVMMERALITRDWSVA